MDRLVFPDVHRVIVCRCHFLHCSIAGAAWFIEELDGDQSLQVRCPALAKKNSMRKWQNCTFQHSVRSYRRLEALDGEELLPIELLECGTTPAGALDHEELLHDELEVEAASPSYKRVASKAAGSSASPTHPFRRVRLRYQRHRSWGQGMAAETTPPFWDAQKPWGGHPSCVQARWLPPFGDCGSVGDPKNRPPKRGTLEGTWVRGEGTREPWRPWRHLFSASCRGNCLRYGYKFQADTPRDGMSLVGFRNWTIGPYIPVRVTYAVLRSRRVPCGPRQLYAVSLLYANAPGLFGGRGEMAMAVPCCLRGNTACGSESRLIGSLCSVSVVISNGLQPSLEGVGPTNEPVDGRVQTWTRHVSDQLSASEHRQDVHRNVCETIGYVQPTRMGNRFWQVSPRGVQVDGCGRGRHLLGVRQYAVVLTYYWVRSRVTSLVGLFVFPFVLEFLLCRAELSGLRFGHFYVFRGPGADALGHTGSLPGCAEQGVLCPGGGKVDNQVLPKAFRF